MKEKLTYTQALSAADDALRDAYHALEALTVAADDLHVGQLGAVKRVTAIRDTGDADKTFNALHLFHTRRSRVARASAQARNARNALTTAATAVKTMMILDLPDEPFAD